MKFYIYDSTTGEYLAQGVAQESPLEPGNWMLPDDSTLIAPPEPGPNKIAVWNGKKWVLKADFRGCVFWSTDDKSRHELEQIGMTPEPVWTEIEPTDQESEWDSDTSEWILPLEVVRKRKKIEIRAQSDIEFYKLTQNYSTVEIDSWAKQESGANDLRNDPESNTENAEFVRAIAKGRGIPVEDLVNKIHAAVENARLMSPGIIGIQQLLEDMADEARTIEEINAIEWPNQIIP